MRSRIALSLVVALLLRTAPALADVDGSVDPAYGTLFGRTVINTFPGLVDDTPALAAFANSASGRTWLFGGVPLSSNRLLIARLVADSGQLDSSFGGGSGKLVTLLPAGVSSFVVNSAVIQVDGKALVAGRWDLNDEERGFVCRLNVAGNLDVSYATGGCRELRAFIYAQEDCLVDDIVADPADSTLLVTGLCSDSSQSGVFRPYLARLTSTGALDVDFGAGAGVTTPTVVGGNLRYINALAIQPGGRFVAIGSNFRATGDYDISAMQFSNDGTLDPGFGAAGVFTISPDIGGDKQDYGADIVVRPDGRILMLGIAEGLDQAGVLVLHQLTAIGTSDSSFGSNGRYQVPETLTRAYGVGGIGVLLGLPHLALDDLGRAVVLARNGLGFNSEPSNARVYRLTAGGAKDRNFGFDQRGAVDISNEVVLPGTGDTYDSVTGLIVSRTRILLGMTSGRAVGNFNRNMVTLTLQGGALFSDGFE